MAPISEHYDGSGEEVMRKMSKTYKNPKTAKRVFYATENKMNSKKGRKKSSKRG